MPVLQINIESTFEKQDLFKVANFTPESVITAALLSPLDIRELDIITLLTNPDCEREDALQIMRKVKKLLGRRANGRHMRTYRVVEEFREPYLDYLRQQNHRSK